MIVSLFDSRHEPVFLNEGAYHSELVLQKMEALQSVVSSRDLERLERDIALTRSGIAGEKRVAFELKNAHYPLVFLHDLNLEHEGNSAQIDFLVISPCNAFVLECKNLVGDIEIQRDGTFVRTFGTGSRRRREAIYSPVTQNTRHVELMKAIIRAENCKLLSRLFGATLDNYFRSLVVLANDKAVISMRNAPNDVRAQVIRCDQLVERIKELDRANREANGRESFAQMQRNAQGWLKRSAPVSVDLAGKYAIATAQDGAKLTEVQGVREAVNQDPSPKPSAQAGASAAVPSSPVAQTRDAAPICPVCGSPMQLRTARYGAHKGEKFWGCSTYWTTRCPGIVTL